MNTVWILVSLVYSGPYMADTIAPTMEFSTQKKCEAAIVTFERIKLRGKMSEPHMRCVAIEK